MSLPTMLVMFTGNILIHIALLVFPALLLPHKLTVLRVAAVSVGMSALAVARLQFETGSAFFVLINLLALAIHILILPALLFSGRVWKRYAVFGSFALALLTSDGISSALTVVRHGTFDAVLLEAPALLTGFGVMLVVFVFFSSTYVLAWKMIAARKFTPYYLLLIIFPAGQMVTMYSFYFEVMGLLWIAGVFIGWAAYLVLLVYVVSLEKKTALEDELREARHAMELQQAYYTQVEARREALAKIRHDFNNHLAAIGRLINSGEENSARDMITALSDGIGETKENPYCDIPVVNAILAEKAEDCAAAGIRLAVQLNMPPGISIPQMHLCSIFGNLLDNAIAACMALPAPVIKLTSGADGDYLFIKCTNPADPPKNPTPGRGYGTRIVSDLVKRHNGDCHAEYKNGIYTVVVMLPMRGATPSYR